MKKNNFKILILLFLSAFSLSSCSSDGESESNGTTTGDYFPIAVNNKWQFTNGSDATELKLIGNSSFGGNSYYELTDTDSDTNVKVWMNKRGASYYQKSESYTETQGSLSITLEGFEIKMFQDDLEVGKTWSGSAKSKVTYTGSGSGSTSLNVSYVGQITARDASVTLGGITYNNVIKMKLTVTETINSQTATISGENWFAKDIGLIYDKTTTSTDGVTKTRYLTSYTLN